MPSGPQQLAAWIKMRFTNPRTARKQAADYLDVDYFQLSHWLGGRRGIGMDNALDLERKTGIPVEAWVSAPAGKSKRATTMGTRNRRLA